MLFGSVENKVLHDFFQVKFWLLKEFLLDEFEGKAITRLDPDIPTAAASLIKRSKPADLPLFSSNTGNLPDWTEFTIMTAPSYDENSGQWAVRQLV